MMKNVRARQDALARRFDRIVNSNYWPAQVGDASGNMNGPDGTIIVRELTSNGLSAPRNVQPPMVYLPLAPGYNVELEYNKHGQPYIVRGDTKNNRAASQATLPTPPRVPDAQSRSAPLAVVPTSPPSLAISIKSWNPILSGVFTSFPGIAEEAAVAPSAGNMYYAVWCVLADLSGAEVLYSTERGVSDLALDDDDVNEALATKTAGSFPVWAQKIVGGQTVITDSDLTNDGRPLQQTINVVDSGGSSAVPYILIRDEKAQNTAGGTFTSGAWRTRDLNTEVFDTNNLASVASNQITLAAGTYEAFITCPVSQVARHQARLYNTSDSAVLLLGTSEFAYPSGGVQNCSTIRGRFTIAASKVLEVQHRCETTESGNGFGFEANFDTEIYTVVELRKVG
jgi:hypothetical protein